MTAYERHLTRLALTIPSTPRGPQAKQRAKEQADASERLAVWQMQRDAVDALAKRAGGRS